VGFFPNATPAKFFVDIGIQAWYNVNLIPGKIIQNIEAWSQIISGGNI
jgi:hypothetical protein